MLLNRPIAYIAAKTAGRQFNRFLAATKDVEEVQDRVLQDHLKLLAGSKFARQYNLARVSNYREFVRAVPILKYQDHKPFIEQLKRGDSGALFSPGRSAGRLVMFALTSGTTDQPKFIPVTNKFIRDYRRGWNIFGVKALLDHPAGFFRKIVQVTSSPRDQQTPSGLWAGAITGMLAQTQNWIVRRYYATPLCATGIKDPIAKAYVIMRLAICQDVAFISTANPASVLRLAQVGQQHGEQLIRDVHDGTLNPPGLVPQDVRDQLDRYLDADASAARRLDRIAQSQGQLLPKDYWRLAFLTNWTAGTMGLYIERFEKYFGSTPVRDMGLLASEGRFSIPIKDGSGAGILEILSNLVEFIPVDEYDNQDPPVLRPWELELGQSYYLIFSNATGLTRYDIGDVVRVVDFYNSTPVIEFLHKGEHVSSVAGEKLTEHQAVEAVKLAAEKLGCGVEGFVICPHWADVPYYALSVQADAVGSRGEELAGLVDQQLMALNIEYKSKRQTARLGPLVVQLVPDGYFQKADLEQIATGPRSEQYKHKFLYNQPDADRDIPCLTAKPG